MTYFMINCEDILRGFKITVYTIQTKMQFVFDFIKGEIYLFYIFWQ